MERLKMYYSRDEFLDNDAAWADFERSWASDNPGIARRLKLEELKDHYEGIHYRDRRWLLLTEVNNYMNADPTPSRGGADNLIGECPRCRKPGLVRRAQWPFTANYVHVTAKVDGKEIEVVSHPIQPDRSGLINANTI
jgi:hypothetical protein